MAQPASDHFDGRRYFSPEAPPLPSFRDLLRWNFGRTEKRGAWPEWVDFPAQTLPERPAAEGVSATWINHATWLLRTATHTFLTDPVFSDRCGPFGRIGPKRVHAPGIPFEQLPRVDTVLLSHNHYDHCDLATLKRLQRRDNPRGVTLPGNARLLHRAGFSRVTELDWWDNTTLPDGSLVTATPAQHWSNRVSIGRNTGLWGGFAVKAGGTQTLFVGDTGYHPHLFKQIGARLGPIDLALIPIGAYEPRWFMRGQHVNPEEAVQIHLDLKASRSLAMHWGTFRLTDESREAPLTALADALTLHGLPAEAFRALTPGESISASSVHAARSRSMA